MSTPSNENSLIRTLTAYFVGSYIETAALCLFLYDYLLTLPREVELVWHEKPRLSTALYITMRYFPAAQLIFELSASSTAPHCDLIYRFVNSLALLGRAGIIVTLTMQTYAICNRNRVMPYGVGLLGMATVGLSFYGVTQQTCTSAVERPIVSRLSFVSSAIRLGFETSVIGLIIFRTFGSFKVQRGQKAFGAPHLSVYILRNGTLYFVTVFVLELMAILFNSVVPNWLHGLPNSLPLPISAILISRFLSNLRNMNAHPNGTTGGPVTLTTFQVANHHVFSTITNDFGDPAFNQHANEVIELESNVSGRCAGHDRGTGSQIGPYVL